MLSTDLEFWNSPIKLLQAREIWYVFHVFLFSISGIILWKCFKMLLMLVLINVK